MKLMIYFFSESVSLIFVSLGWGSGMTSPSTSERRRRFLVREFYESSFIKLELYPSMGPPMVILMRGSELMDLNSSPNPSFLNVISYGGGPRWPIYPRWLISSGDIPWKDYGKRTLEISVRIISSCASRFAKNSLNGFRTVLDSKTAVIELWKIF